MSHLDPEQLALLALGEPVASDADRVHLDSCPACVAEIADLTHAATVGRATVDDAELELPRAAVWDRIHRELDLDRSLAADPLRPAPVPGARHPIDEPPTTEPATSGPTTSGPTTRGQATAARRGPSAVRGGRSPRRSPR